MSGIFDSHAHYDDPAFDCDREELLSSLLPQGGVDFVMNCGTTPDSSRASLLLSQRYDYFLAAVGLHPEEITGDDEAALHEIETLAAEKSCAAIGEIGLDYHFRNDNKEAQIAVFEAQLEMANRLQKPVIIHDREAHEDTLCLLKKYRPQGVLHCFSGSAESAKEILSLGLYIGLGGAVTFKNARKPLEVAAMVPENRLLLETDCPYMAPVPFRGQRNDSRHIFTIAEKIAPVRGVSPGELIDSCSRSAKVLFHMENGLT